MDDELKMDASGCWVMKNARVITETPLRSQSERYNKSIYSPDVRDDVNNDKQDEVLITGWSRRHFSLPDWHSVDYLE